MNGVQQRGDFFDRALGRASLRAWGGDGSDASVHPEDEEKPEGYVRA